MDERSPIAKVPHLVAEIRRQQAALDAQAVERLVMTGGHGEDSSMSRNGVLLRPEDVEGNNKVQPRRSPMNVSPQFLIAVRMSPTPAYKLAQAVGLTGTEFSKIIHGALPINDRRQRQIERIAAKLGVKGHEVFEA